MYPVFGGEINIPRRMFDALLLELIQRLRVVAQAQTEGKADDVHHEIGEFVVPRLLNEFERQVELKHLPTHGKGEEDPPVGQQVAANEGPLNEMTQRPQVE